MPEAFIHQLNISAGGVPKRPVPQVSVDPDGIAGDLHSEPQPRHGGPDKALCLLALEVIERLAAEGHPIRPGSTGENVTTSGLDWSQVAPGTRLRLGAEVLLEITAYTTPCKSIAGSFAGRDFARLSHKAYPGDSRVYARVLRGGTLTTGDPIHSLAPPRSNLER